MTRCCGIEDEAGRPERTGNVERQSFLNSPSNAVRGVEITPLEQFESRFSHAPSTLQHRHPASPALCNMG